MRFWGKRCSRLVGRSPSNPPNAILFLGAYPMAGSGELAPRYGTANNYILDIVEVSIGQWYLLEAGSSKLKSGAATRARHLQHLCQEPGRGDWGLN
jgi:hypothetical protein